MPPLSTVLVAAQRRSRISLRERSSSYFRRRSFCSAAGSRRSAARSQSRNWARSMWMKAVSSTGSRFSASGTSRRCHRTSLRSMSISSPTRTRRKRVEKEATVGSKRISVLRNASKTANSESDTQNLRAKLLAQGRFSSTSAVNCCSSCREKAGLAWLAAASRKRVPLPGGWTFGAEAARPRFDRRAFFMAAENAFIYRLPLPRPLKARLLRRVRGRSARRLRP